MLEHIVCECGMLRSTSVPSSNSPNTPQMSASSIHPTSLFCQRCCHILKQQTALVTAAWMTSVMNRSFNRNVCLLSSRHLFLGHHYYDFHLLALVANSSFRHTFLYKLLLYALIPKRWSLLIFTANIVAPSQHLQHASQTWKWPPRQWFILFLSKWTTTISPGHPPRTSPHQVGTTTSWSARPRVTRR